MNARRGRIELDRRMAEAARRRLARDNIQIEADSIIRAYEEAFEALHGKAPSARITYASGWYVFDSAPNFSKWGKRRRRRQWMVERTAFMQAQLHAQEIEAKQCDF